MWTLALDYLLFFGFLIGSTLYPLWNGINCRKRKETDVETGTKANYVFATGQVSIFAMMLSIARGTLGVRSFLGYPSELFYRGTGMWETLYGLVTAYPIVCFVFVPVYLNLGITSVYQYLDLRFKSKLVRRLASATFIVRNLFILGITLYTPCVAMNTIVSVPYWASFLLMTVLGVCFTIFGNLKAVITADVIQGITMIIVSIAVIVQGAYESGGVEKAYTINKDQGRLEFFKFSGDITTRVDTLSAWLGQLFISLSVLGCQQNNVQRYMSMKSQKDVTYTLMANVPFVSFLFSLAWVVGMGIFATYYNCDPMITGDINRMDEILPYFIDQKLSYIPGFIGLFMATLFNGSLCIFVSTLNSLATVTWEDFLSPLNTFQKRSDRFQLVFIKSLGVMYAVLTMGVAFLVSLFSGVIEISMFVNAATSGTLVGVFLLAMLIPFANSKGASTGMIVSHLTILALTIYKFSSTNILTINPLPTSVEACDAKPNITTSIFTETHFSNIERYSVLNHTMAGASDLEFNAESTTPSYLDNILNMSYMYYSVVGSLITVLVGCIVSLCTSDGNDKSNRQLVHPILLRWTASKEGKFNLCDDDRFSSSKSSSAASSKTSTLVGGIVNPLAVTLEKDSESRLN